MAIGAEAESQPRSYHVGARLLEVAAAHPDRVALVEGNADRATRRRWTYRQLADEAIRAALALVSRFTAGERVAVWAPGIPEWSVLQYGAALAGVVLVPVNPSARRPEAEYALAQSRCSGVFVVEEFRGSPLRELATELARELPGLREVVDLAEWSDFLDSAAPDAVLPVPDANAAALIIYTSGTTGAPKGALLSHRGILRNAEAAVTRGEVGLGAVWLNPLPMFHSGGCIFIALGALACEGTVIQLATFDPGLCITLIEQERAVVTSCVATMIIAMMEQPHFPSTDVSSMVKTFTGGSSIPPELVYDVEKRFGISFVMTYGQTEGGPTICMSRPDDPIEVKSTSIGAPLDGYEAKVVDHDSGAALPVGQTGELCIRSGSTMLGYFDKPDETARAIDGEGWLHTGDLCSLDDQGYVHHHGRLKDVIIRGGENIAPGEVEALLFTHPSVLDVSVVGVPDPRYGEKVVAFVRWSASAEPPREATLIEFARESLARYKVPAQVWFVDEFPLTPSGKVKKFELKVWHERYATQPAAGDVTDIPRGAPLHP